MPDRDSSPDSTQLAQTLTRYYDVPKEIQSRPPTTDTYSAECTQEEFFFRLPFDLMDLLWYARESNVPIVDVAFTMSLREKQIQRVFGDLAKTTCD